MRRRPATILVAILYGSQLGLAAGSAIGADGPPWFAWIALSFATLGLLISHMMGDAKGMS